MPPRGSGKNGAGLSALIKLLLVGLVLVLGSQLRLIAVAETGVDTPIRLDAKDYIYYAYNLKHYNVYSRSSLGHVTGAPPAPDGLRSPGYPLFLTVFIKQLNPEEIALVTLAQALFSSLVILLTFLLCAQLVPWGLALSAALLTAISPHLVNSNIYVLTESLFTGFLAVVFAVAVIAGKSTRPWWWLLVGLLLGAAALVRPSMQYFPVLLVLLLVWQFPGRKAFKASVAVLAGFVLSYGPWVLRNLMVLGEPSDPTLMINFLHHGMYPGFMYQYEPETFGYAYKYDPNSAAISQSVGSVLAAIRDNFIAQPIEYLRWYSLEKPMFFWSWGIVQGMGGTFVYPVIATPYAESGYFKLTHAIASQTYLPALLLAAFASLYVWLPRAGLIFGQRAVLVVRLVALLLLYLTALHMIGAPFPRYSIPLKPWMYVMAMAGLWIPWRIVALRRQKSGNGTDE